MYNAAAAYSLPYMDSCGAVISMTPTHWRAVNGLSMLYPGWGAEDDDLYSRIRQSGLLSGGCAAFCGTSQAWNGTVWVSTNTTPSDGHDPVRTMARPPAAMGRFSCQGHARGSAGKYLSTWEQQREDGQVGVLSSREEWLNSWRVTARPIITPASSHTKQTTAQHKRMFQRE